jgi:hypothetical protein
MRKPIHITTPRPTFEEVAKIYHVPKHRQKRLKALADELVRQMEVEEARSADKAAGRGKKRKNAAAAA